MVTKINVKFDICFVTRAASNNKYVLAVQKILDENNIQTVGQYRGDDRFALHSHQSVPDDVLDEITAAAPAAVIRRWE